MRWIASDIEFLFRKFAKDRDYNFRDMMVGFGKDFTGQQKWAPLFKGMEIMGKRRVLKRLDNLIKHYK